MSVFISQGHQFFLFGSQLPDRRLTGSYPETGFGEVSAPAMPILRVCLGAR
jgi:hypothetical protein